MLSQENGLLKPISIPLLITSSSTYFYSKESPFLLSLNIWKLGLCLYKLNLFKLISFKLVGTNGLFWFIFPYTFYRTVTYRKVASSNKSRFEAHFRLLTMKKRKISMAETGHHGTLLPHC